MGGSTRANIRNLSAATVIFTVFAVRAFADVDDAAFAFGLIACVGDE